MKKKAILILAHDNELFFGQLIESLTHPDFDIFVHIDKKKDIKGFYERVVHLGNNITFIKDREDGRWGDIGIVKATINLLKSSIEFKYTHYMLISGSDKPIKSLASIRDFLDANLIKSFIEFEKFPIKKLNYGGADRLYGISYNLLGKRHTFVPFNLKPIFNLKGQILNIILGSICFYKKRHLPLPFDAFHYGSQWWTINHEAAIYILNFLKKNPKYVAFHKRTLLPDEIFFQTILANNEELELINDNLRYIVWANGNHPEYLDNVSQQTLESTNKHFARKFKYFN